MQTLLVLVAVSVAVQLVAQIVSYGAIAPGDFRVWTTVLEILSLGVIFSIQWLEHSRLRYAHGVALFYWLLLIIASAVKLRSLVSQQIYAESLLYFVPFCIGFGFSLAAFLVEWLWPRHAHGDAYEAIEEEDECPVEYATVFSRLTFDWMTPLMRHGYKVFLTENDLWGLAKVDQTKVTGSAFDQSWESELKKRPNSPSLWLTLFHAYGGPYMVAAIYKVGNDISQYVQPQLLRLLIAFAASYRKGNTPQPVVQGAAISLAMFGVAVFQTAMIVS